MTAGIWKDVKLNFWNTAKIEHLKIEQKVLTKQKAELQIRAEIIAENEGNYSFTTDLQNHKIFLRKGLNKISVPFTIENPHFWQPQRLGKSDVVCIEIFVKERR